MVTAPEPVSDDDDNGEARTFEGGQREGMKANSLENRTVLVTGAASGFGRSMALGLLAAGARVALTDVSAQHLKAVNAEVRSFGNRTAVFAADLANADQVNQLIHTLVPFGTVDVLINNAGIAPGAGSRDYVTNPVRFWHHDEAATRRYFEINSIAPYLLARALVGGMIERRWGRIVNVTTSLGSMMRGGMAGYGGSKAGLESHTAIMAADLEGTGVTANVLIPGGASNTPMIPAESGFDRAALIQPEAMVAPILWLASVESDGVTACRFIAAKWDPALPNETAARESGAPVAWSELGAQTIFPKDYVQKS